MTHLGIPDRPVTGDNGDTLEIGNYARALASFLQKCDTPMTVGIQGDWGAGKTSLMNMVQARLNPENPPGKSTIRTVFFNTWMYSQFDLGDQLSLLMLSSFVKKLTGDKTDFSGKKLLQWASKIGPNIISKQLTGMSIKELAGGEGNSLGGETNLLESLKKEFEILCEELTTNSGLERIVFFVDDLDRLPPARAVELLEVMKNFLDVPRVVFVLACDYAVIAQGVEARLGITNQQDGGRSFFDKIIQVPFKMPVHAYKLGRFVGDLLEKVDWKLESGEEVIAVYQRLLEHSIGFNPRSIKRLFNSLLLVKMVLEEDKVNRERILTDPHMLRLLFAIVCMEMAHSKLHRHLASELSPARLAPLASEEAFQELCSGSDSPYGGDDPGATAMEFALLFHNLVDRDRNQDISDEELAALRTVFNVSSVTSVSSGPPTEVRERIRWAEDTFHDKTVDTLGEETAELVRDFFQFCKSDGRHQGSFGRGRVHGSFTVRFRFAGRSKPIGTLTIWTAGDLWLWTTAMRDSGVVGCRAADRLDEWIAKTVENPRTCKSGTNVVFAGRPDVLPSLMSVLRSLIDPARPDSPDSDGVTDVGEAVAT